MNFLKLQRIQPFSENFIILQSIFLRKVYTQQYLFVIVMEQQIILEMYDGRYPFGHLNHTSSNLTIYVRRIIKFTKENYNSLKQKFNMVKNLNNLNIIKLVKVLEEDSQFHLLYQYIPQKLQFIKQKKKEQVENYKVKLIYISSFLIFHSINTKFEFSNFGFDDKGQIKFYLGIDFYPIQGNQEIIKNRYMFQIKEICRLMLNSNTHKQKPQQKYNFNYEYFKSLPPNPETNNSRFKKGAWNSKSYQNSKFNPYITQSTMNDNAAIEKLNRQKSKSSKKPKVLEILNNIELKIDYLRSHRNKLSNFKSNEKNITERQKKQKCQRISQKELQGKDCFEQDSLRIIKSRKQKLDQRKYSGDQNNLSQFLKKNPYIDYESPKSLRTRKEAKNNYSLEKINEAEQYDKQRQYQKMMQNKKKVNSVKKHPKTKKDFEQLKIEQFNKFSNCKEQYIHQFIGLLDDEKSFNNNNSNVTTKDASSSINLEVASFQNIQKLEPQLKKKNRPSIQSPKKPLERLKSKQLLHNSPKPINTNDINNINNTLSNSKRQNDKKMGNLNIGLKKRINQAILKSDEALQRYHKIHSPTNHTKNLNLSFQNKK